MIKKLLFFFVLIVSIYSATIVQAVPYGEILSAETRCGNIAPSQIDSYTFTGNIGETVIIQMSRLTDSFFDPTIDLYDKDNMLETTVSATNSNVFLQNHQLLQTGLYTIVVRDAGGNDSDDYNLSFTKQGTLQSPVCRLTLNNNSFQIGDTLIITAKTKNGPDPVDVEAKTWIDLPNGDQGTILYRHCAFAVQSNADLTSQIFSYTFVGSEPSGDYNAGCRFINPISGREISANVKLFSFSP
jgi:hypothetical protein